MSENSTKHIRTPLARVRGYGAARRSQSGSCEHAKRWLQEEQADESAPERASEHSRAGGGADHIHGLMQL